MKTIVDENILLHFHQVGDGEFLMWIGRKLPPHDKGFHVISPGESLCNPE